VFQVIANHTVHTVHGLTAAKELYVCNFPEHTLVNIQCIFYLIQLTSIFSFLLLV